MGKAKSGKQEYKRRAEGRQAHVFALSLAAALLRNQISCADFASNSPRFVFERADGKIGAGVSVAKIFLKIRLEAAASFALSNMCELVYDQLAIAPAIGANDNAMADGDGAGSVGNDIGMSRGLSQLFIIRQDRKSTRLNSSHMS